MKPEIQQNSIPRIIYTKISQTKHTSPDYPPLNISQVTITEHCTCNRERSKNNKFINLSSSAGNSINDDLVSYASVKSVIVSLPHSTSQISNCALVTP